MAGPPARGGPARLKTVARCYPWILNSTAGPRWIWTRWCIISSFSRPTPPPAQVCAVVKAGAYGHGDGMVCRALEAAGAKWFAVSCLSEALHLRAAGIGGDILILGRTDPACAASLVRYGLTQAVFSPEYARQLAASAVETHRSVQVHLKVDTGMGRIGFVALQRGRCGPLRRRIERLL